MALALMWNADHTGSVHNLTAMNSSATLYDRHWRRKPGTYEMEPFVQSHQTSKVFCALALCLALTSLAAAWLLLARKEGWDSLCRKATRRWEQRYDRSPKPSSRLGMTSL